MRNNSRPQRPAETVTPAMVANVETFVNKDRRVTLHEVATQFSIGEASAHQILRESKRSRRRRPWQKNNFLLPASFHKHLFKTFN